jgi:hypothetical protein
MRVATGVNDRLLLGMKGTFGLIWNMASQINDQLFGLVTRLVTVLPGTIPRDLRFQFTVKASALSVVK